MAVLAQFPHKALQFCISEVILHFQILPKIPSLVYLVSLHHCLIFLRMR